jgi:hypothetical protein
MKQLLWALCLALFAGQAKAQGLQYSKFAGLYTQDKSVQDTIDRLSKMEQLRGSAQDSLERLMKTRTTPDLELRFGELIVQRGRELQQFSIEVLVAGDAKKGEELKSQSLKLLNQGLALHRKLLGQLKNHPMAPKVYLGIARTEYGLGRKQAAFNAADDGLRLLRSDSKGLGQTRLDLLMVKGDASFDLSKASLALSAYSDALKLVSDASVEQAYLNYKLAWVHYNLKDSNTALGHLNELFKSSGDRFALKQEAVQDYALFLADLSSKELDQKGGLQDQYSYLLAKSDDRWAQMAFERMAQTYSKNGRRAEAIGVYEFLIQDQVSNDKNVDRALTVVELTHSLADKKKLVSRYFWLISDFGPRSTWFKAQATKPQIQKKASDAIEAQVRKFAIADHQDTYKETNTEVRSKREAIISELYDTHIANFSRPEDVPRAEAGRVHFYRAEIHRRASQWAEAGARYDSYLRILEVVPKDQISKTDDKLRDEALVGAVEVWAKSIEKDPKWVPQMLAAADRFLLLRASDKLAPQVLLDAALVEHKSGKGSLATSRLSQLVKTYPKTKQAAEAVDAILDILNKESDYVNLAQKARGFLNTVETWAQAGEREKQKQSLTKILSQTEAKACDALSKDSNRRLEAALCFESFARGFEKDAQAPKALLMAADIYDQLKDPASAVSSLEVLVKKYPTTEHADRGFSRLALVYEKSFEFEKAASIYETLLSKSQKSQDREQLLARHLEVLYSLGKDEQFKKWMGQPTTPSSLKVDYRNRANKEAFIALRIEESTAGYNKDGLASLKGQKLFADLRRRLQNESLQLEELLEYRRISGNIHKINGQLDKADQEWMLGLKSFWAAKTRSSEVWESAARLRLDQAAVWEIAFKNTELLVNPARKAELFKKLEAWYAEVVEMRSPSVALAALWRSAELNAAFADDVRNAPVPPELLAPENASQKLAYEKLIRERTDPLKKKALNIVEKIAQRAREWKVVSPVVLSSLKVVSNLRSGVELPGRLVASSQTDLLQFPWSDLPRWMDLTAEQEAWTEWQLSNLELAKLAGSTQAARSASRHAAFILLARSSSSDNRDVAKWVGTFTDKAGVQLRIQSYIAERDYKKAQLFLNQYTSFFGTDAFAQNVTGHFEWSRGNFEAAYSRWVRPDVAQSYKDFRATYFSEGWASLFDEILEGGASPSAQKQLFARLMPQASKPWQKQFIAKLCIERRADCSASWSESQTVDLLAGPSDPSLTAEFKDGKSVFEAKRVGLEAFVATRVPLAKNYQDIEVLRRALSGLYGLQKVAIDQQRISQEYWSHRKLVDEQQEKLDREAKQKIIAEVKQ